MGTKTTQLSGLAKALVTLLAMFLMGLGARAFLFKGSDCPIQSKKWVDLGYPQSTATDKAIANFVSKEQLLVDLEDWAGELECSGNGNLLGRTLAEIKHEGDGLKLSTVLLGIAAKGPKNRGPKAAADLQAIFASPAAQSAFPLPIVAEFVDSVKRDERSFQKALYEILFRSLPPETASDFRSNTRLAELLKIAGSQ